MLLLYRVDNPAYSFAARQLPTARRGLYRGRAHDTSGGVYSAALACVVHGSRLYEMPHSCSRCMYASASASASAGHQLSIFRTQLIQCRDNSRPLCAVSPRPSTHGAMRWMIDSTYAPAIRNPPRHCVAVREVQCSLRLPHPSGDLPLPAPPQDARRTNALHASRTSLSASRRSSLPYI